MFEKLGAYFSNNFRKEDEDIYDEENYADEYETENEDYYFL